jgi:hypothetical protein
MKPIQLLPDLLARSGSKRSSCASHTDVSSIRLEGQKRDLPTTTLKRTGHIHGVGSWLVNRRSTLESRDFE